MNRRLARALAADKVSRTQRAAQYGPSLLGVQVLDPLRLHQNKIALYGEVKRGNPALNVNLSESDQLIANSNTSDSGKLAWGQKETAGLVQISQPQVSEDLKLAAALDLEPSRVPATVYKN